MLSREKTVTFVGKTVEVKNNFMKGKEGLLLSICFF